jgi:hypothetical protein
MIASKIRELSSAKNQSPLPLEERNDDVTTWTDPQHGLLGPADRRLPLPGNVGIASHLSQPIAQSMKSHSSSLKETEVLCTTTERQLATMTQFTQYNELMEESLQDDESHPSSAVNVLECVAQSCPKLLLRDFQEMFPGRELSSGKLTVVVLSQRTFNDMSVWSHEVEMEREELLLYFVIAAEEICKRLQDMGYWADFIDPSSGRAYLGEYSHATMFETDERYRHLGFTIEDLGCCRVLRHHRWGTRAFVGCLLTDAPMDNPDLQNVLEMYQPLDTSKC